MLFKIVRGVIGHLGRSEPPKDGLRERKRFNTTDHLTAYAASITNTCRGLPSTADFWVDTR